MPLPLSGLTFYRMADASPPGTAISDLLDAIYTSLVATVDYRGTSLASTHRHTVNRRRPTAVTEEVDAVLANGSMGRTPVALSFAGRIANAGTMASPDTSAASVLQAGINKNSGAYADWTAAAPFTSGQWFGYWRVGNASSNAAATIVRSFISQETILIQIVQPTVTNQCWWYGGAIVEPYDADTTNSGETDNRLYGQITSGGTAVGSTWTSNASGGASIFGHSTTASQNHSGVFTPNSGTLIPGGRRSIRASVASAAELQTPSGVYVGEILEWGRSVSTNNNSGNRMGTIRGVYLAGSVQSGRYLRSGTTDLYHFVSVDTGAAADGLMLPAAP